MKKQLSIFLAVIFLTVQVSSFVHMAKFGFEHHDHSGVACQVESYFNASQSFDSAHAKIHFAENPVVETFAYVVADDSQHAFKAFSDNSARAPPSIS